MPWHKPHRYCFWHCTQFLTAQQQAPAHHYQQSSPEFTSAREEKRNKIPFSHRTQIPTLEPPAYSGDIAGTPPGELPSSAGKLDMPQPSPLINTNKNNNRKQ